MEPLLILGVASGILAAVLVNIAIWAPRQLWIKLAALAAAASFLPIAYAGFAELLGRPKPAREYCWFCILNCVCNVVKWICDSG